MSEKIFKTSEQCLCVYDRGWGVGGGGSRSYYIYVHDYSQEFPTRDTIRTKYLFTPAGNSAAGYQYKYLSTQGGGGCRAVQLNSISQPGQAR